MGGECSHHCTIPAPLKNNISCKILEGKWVFLKVASIADSCQNSLFFFSLCLSLSFSLYEKKRRQTLGTRTCTGNKGLKKEITPTHKRAVSFAGHVNVQGGVEIIININQVSHSDWPVIIRQHLCRSSGTPVLIKLKLFKASCVTIPSLWLPVLGDFQGYGKQDQFTCHVMLP